MNLDRRAPVVARDDRRIGYGQHRPCNNTHKQVFQAWAQFSSWLSRNATCDKTGCHNKNLVIANAVKQSPPCDVSQNPFHRTAPSSEHEYTMALTATINKAELNISDMDRHYYGSHQLTIAQHPSETDTRMMVRLLAFALHASEQLQFTKGLCVDDEPELWQKNFSDEIELWVELGQPEEKRLRKACGRAREVVLYCYSGNAADIWWQQSESKLQRFDNLRVVNLPAEQVEQLAGLASRNMSVQCSIQDGEVWLSSEQGEAHLTPIDWKNPS